MTDAEIARLRRGLAEIRRMAGSRARDLAATGVRTGAGGYNADLERLAAISRRAGELLEEAP